MRRYTGYPLSLLGSDMQMPVVGNGHVNFEVSHFRHDKKWWPPPLAVRSLSWEASAVGLSIQVFEVGSLRKGEWGPNSLNLYPIMVAMGMAGSWQLDASTPVHLVDKSAHGRVCIANRAAHTVHLSSLVLWCEVIRTKAEHRDGERR